MTSNNKDYEPDFTPLSRTVTVSNFFSYQHFSRNNYTRTALSDIVDHEGKKPKRQPKQASNAMIRDTEQRLGFKLPDTLRALYKVQDGGGLPTYFVPKYEDAPALFDEWISAFAYDYDDLRPLDQLEILHDSYMDYFDEEYDDPSEKDDWIAGSEKLVILTIRTGYGTALDYREGPEPGVLLFDHGEEPVEQMRFESFDAFMSALHEIDFDYGGKGPEQKDVAYGDAPDPQDPDQFWKKGNDGPPATESDWKKKSEALGVTLPPALLPFYQAANGGNSTFQVALAKEPEAAPMHVFPKGVYVDAGLFSRLEHFASLATLSDRLDFIDDRTQWRNLYDNPDKLIVISAAFDAAILLDYRQSSDAPSVLCIPDLDQPETANSFESVEDFLDRLRAFGISERDKSSLGDERLSAAGSNAQSFWLDNDQSAPVAPEVLQAFIEKWGFTTFGLPHAITEIYEQQNGGKVRFRFAPPQSVNDMGYVMRNEAASHWNDVFPDGLLPMEDWQPFDDWRAKHKLALDQSLFDFTGHLMEPSNPQDSDVISLAEDSIEDVSLRLFVIGEHISQPNPTLTLLDMSSDYFNRNRDLMTISYDAASDQFTPLFGPILVDNIYSGLHQTMKALREEV